MMNPQLTLIGRPTFEDEHIKFLTKADLEWTPTSESTAAERIIEFSGRICYLSFDPNPRTRLTTSDYVRKLIHLGHESVLEHVQWTFILDGVTRGFSHQLVRHRVGFAFSQLSQQYHDESEAIILKPDGIEDVAELSDLWNEIDSKIHRFYKLALNCGRPSEALSTREQARQVRSFARSLLPNATRTILSVSANARALRHFLSIRGALEGDVEMRRVSALIFEMLEDEAPSVVADFYVSEMEDGSPIVRTRL